MANAGTMLPISPNGTSKFKLFYAIKSKITLIYKLKLKITASDWSKIQAKIGRELMRSLIPGISKVYYVGMRDKIADF